MDKRRESINAHIHFIFTLFKLKKHTRASFFSLISFDLFFYPFDNQIKFFVSILFVIIIMMMTDEFIFFLIFKLIKKNSFKEIVKVKLMNE